MGESARCKSEIYTCSEYLLSLAKHRTLLLVGIGSVISDLHER